MLFSRCAVTYYLKSTQNDTTEDARRCEKTQEDAKRRGREYWYYLIVPDLHCSIVCTRDQMRLIASMKVVDAIDTLKKKILNL